MRTRDLIYFLQASGDDQDITLYQNGCQGKVSSQGAEFLMPAVKYIGISSFYSSFSIHDTVFVKWGKMNTLNNGLNM